MNVYDSARMVDVLVAAGYEPAGAPDGADLIVLNTCHIRDKAGEKVYAELGRLKRLQGAGDGRARKRPLIAVAGCVAQAEGEELLARAPFVDVVIGPQSYQHLADAVREVEGASRPVVATEFPAIPKFDSLPEASAPGGATAFLTVQEGCDKFCTFCVVPYTRGVEYSRPVEAVLREARRYASSGVREITLLGQNVNCYHGQAPDGGEWGLGRLIRALADIEGIERIRYTTSYPPDHDDALIDSHRDVAQLMPFLHLPVQSGSDRILAAMNRRHNADEYRRLVDRLRTARPDLAMASDFIVGFPGESDAEFRETLRLVADVGFSQAYSFCYSPRLGTPAARLPQVPAEIASHRLHELQELLDRQQRTFNEACVGSEVPVLFDKLGRKQGQIVGRTPYMQAVHVEADEALLGTIGRVAILAAGPNSLAGALSGSEAG